MSTLTISREKAGVTTNTCPSWPTLARYEVLVPSVKLLLIKIIAGLRTATALSVSGAGQSGDRSE